jgi:hypothetical protein
MTTSVGLATARPEDLAAAGTRAAIIVVCREPDALEILGRELSKRYGADYQIVVYAGPRSWRPGCGTCWRRPAGGHSHRRDRCAGPGWHRGASRDPGHRRHGGPG